MDRLVDRMDIRIDGMDREKLGMLMTSRKSASQPAKPPQQAALPIAEQIAAAAAAAAAAVFMCITTVRASGLAGWLATDCRLSYTSQPGSLLARSLA